MDVVIVGNGVAGVTTATELRKKDPSLNITLISGETLYHYSRPALMYIYMRDMKLKHTEPYEKSFWKKQRIHLVHDWVTDFKFDQKKLVLKDSSPITYGKLVLAVGAKGRRYGWPGQDLPGVLSFTNLQELDQMEARTAKVSKNFRTVIVGGGLIGIEVAEMMACRRIPTTFLVREQTYWSLALSPEEGRLIQEETLEHGIDLKMETELSSIQPNEQGEVGSITTSRGETIPCNMVVLTAGVAPNIEQFKDTRLKTDRGIQVDRKFKTNIPDVYACGDCAEIAPALRKGRPDIELLWYTGKMHGKVVAENILGGNISYDRGIWYNSAKFFSIDYHTYGQVNQNVRGEKEIYYQVPGKKQSIRIVYLPKRVIGFNTLGIRFRHYVCEEWINEKRSIDYVLEHLPEANFDPEFFETFESEVKKWYEKKAS